MTAIRLGDVTVCAPEREQSGVSSSLTLYRPLFVRTIKGEPVPTYAVDGSPVDTVKLALMELLEEPPRATDPTSPPPPARR